MPPSRRSILFGALVLSLCTACGFKNGGSSIQSSAAANGGTGTSSGGSTSGGGGGFGGFPGITGTHDAVLATPSVAGPLSVAAGANQTLAITFTSSDGLPISGFGISGTTLPKGWAGPAVFSCALVSTGSDCVLNLTFAPATAGSGALNLKFLFIDNAGLRQAPGGSLTIEYAGTAANNVVATASPTGQITAIAGAAGQAVNVNFTTDNGHAATQLALPAGTTGLPPGWSAAATSFGCAIVSTGSGCQLALTYAPTAAASSTLALDYSYTDDMGAPRTGTLNIPYAATTVGGVIAATAPSGQIEAAVNAGVQPVTVTFMTDTGTAAGNLFLTTSLAALPPGWSGPAGGFDCASVGPGNGCQLQLSYAPASLASGTLTLNYDYDDAAGAPRSGTLNIPYTATTDDNVVGTVAPSGRIDAVANESSQAVSVAFTTDDDRPATALQLNTSLATLPNGWSGQGAAFACAGVGAGDDCTLSLLYSPTAAANGTLSLNYGYLNNAGLPKTGTVTVAYRATTDDQVVATANPGAVNAVAGTSTTVSIDFATDDGQPASGLSVTSGLAPLPPGWSGPAGGFSCATLSAGANCQLVLTYAPIVAAPAATLVLGFNYTNDAGLAKNGTATVSYGASLP